MKVKQLALYVPFGLRITWRYIDSDLNTDTEFKNLFNGNYDTEIKRIDVKKDRLYLVLERPVLVKDPHE
jgi:alpha-amylase/alpha-mannosidase (GH57 family)